MVHEHREDRLPALIRAQERDVSPTIKEQDGVQDELHVRICRLCAKYVRDIDIVSGIA